jgi:hypothetical protein
MSNSLKIENNLANMLGQKCIMHNRSDGRFHLVRRNCAIFWKQCERAANTQKHPCNIFLAPASNAVEVAASCLYA